MQPYSYPRLRLMKTVVILISGRGSNMRALLETNLPDCKFVVISNQPTAEGLAYAKARGLTTLVIDHRGYPSRADFDVALSAAIDAHQPDLLILAGFMRILGESFVRHYQGRLINIHPSLLPAFPGLHTHAQALAAGVRIHGCTVHFVTPALDAGPVVIQAAVPVFAGDNEQALAERVLAQEHVIYPRAVRWFLDGRLQLGDSGHVLLDGEQASTAILISPLGE